jgi:SAM-dependent methyltransferase
MKVRRREPPISYAEQTYDSPFWLIRYAHRKRHALAIAKTLTFNPSVVLDYGAGVGEMMFALLADSRCPPSTRAIAYEPWYILMPEDKERQAGMDPTGRLQLATTREEIPENTCDVVICAGVLEHLTLSERHKFYQFARHVLRPEGRVVIDVPIELGPAVLIKNFGRRVLKSYPREYTLRETVAATLGFTVFDPGRYDPELGDEFIATHKGFDYRLLKKELSGQGFTLETTINSPVPWLPAALANQEVIIVASKTPAPSSAETPAKTPAATSAAD